MEEGLKHRDVAAAGSLEGDVPGPDVDLGAHLLGVDVGRGDNGGADEVKGGEAELLGVRHGGAERVDLADDGGETLGEVGVEHDHLVGVHVGDESLGELLGVLARELAVETGTQQTPPLLLLVVLVLLLEDLILGIVHLGGVELIVVLLVGDVGDGELVLGFVLVLGETLAVADVNLGLEILVGNVHEVGLLGGIDEVLNVGKKGGNASEIVRIPSS